jgi:hypothetical protein
MLPRFADTPTHLVSDTYPIRIRKRFAPDTPVNVSERFNVKNSSGFVGLGVSDTCLSIIQNLHTLPHGSIHRRSCEITNKTQLKWKTALENRT